MSLRKFLLIVFVLSFAFLNSNRITQARDADLILDIKDAQKKGTNLEEFINQGLKTDFVSTLFFMAGEIPDDYKTNHQAFVPGGMIGNVNGLLAKSFSPPVSGVLYLAEMKDNLLGSPAYAQGAGFVGLQPILPVWRAFRNIVFALASVFFIATGIMVMFRVKISPQAVVTIQSAVPQVVTTLILVAFSYAISALLIDLSNLVLGLSVATLFAAVGKPLTSSLLPETFAASGNTFTFAHLMESGLARTYDLTASLIVRGVFSSLTTLSNSIINIPQIINPVGGILVIGSIGMGAVILIIIFCIILLIMLLGLLWGLIKVYATVIFMIITAPVQIGLGAIPGVKNYGFSTWFTNLIANILVFPITFIFILIAAFVVSTVQTKGGLWTPGIIDPGNVVSGGNLATLFIGIGALMLIHQLPSLIPQLVFNIKPSGWETAIGKGYGAYKPYTMAPVQVAANANAKYVKTRQENGDPVGFGASALNFFFNEARKRKELS